MILILVSAVALMAGAPGIRPRASTAEYPAHASTGVAEFGAVVIPAGEAKKIFAADIDKAGYIVIEVGVFPAGGQEIDLSPLDFTLRTDPNAAAERTADIDAVAAAARPGAPASGAEAPSEEVIGTAGASVQHVSYPDPVTGKKTGATIVGVNSGVSADRTSGAHQTSGGDAGRLEQQLWEKSLPDGRTSAAVAGYLYFPKPARKARNSSWVLRWENAAGRVDIDIPKSVK